MSVEILHRTIEHFKAQGKRVVVVGHSYGAFLITRYLAIEGPDAADRYLIMAGRLDMPDGRGERDSCQRTEPYLVPRRGKTASPVSWPGVCIRRQNTN